MRFITTTAVPFSPTTAGPADTAWAPAVSLDCTRATVRIPRMGEWLPPADYTMEFWCYTQSTDCTTAFNMEVDDGGNRALAHMPCGNTLFFDNGSLYTTGRVSAIMPPDFLLSWHHVALQVDSQAPAMRIFIDGQLLVQSTGYDTHKPRPVDFIIGINHAGRLGEFRLWDYVRTPAEIRADMPRLLASSRPGLLGCWRLDDTLDHGARIRDYSGYARHGSLNHR
jgi:hypothetical protein